MYIKITYVEFVIYCKVLQIKKYILLRKKKKSEFTDSEFVFCYLSPQCTMFKFKFKLKFIYIACYST